MCDSSNPPRLVSACRTAPDPAPSYGKGQRSLKCPRAAVDRHQQCWWLLCSVQYRLSTEQNLVFINLEPDIRTHVSQSSCSCLYANQLLASIRSSTVRKTNLRLL